MEASDQVYTLGALPPGNNAADIEYETGWAQGSVCPLQNGEKYLVPKGNWPRGE
jgi:hypothetical protein